MGFAPQRTEDWAFAYQVRPLVLDLGSRRAPISLHEMQLLLAELGRLPGARYGAAEEMAVELIHGSAGGCVVSLDVERRRCVLRALEGARARGPLPGGLAKLRSLLVHVLEPVV
jgi:hypothetical protein